MKTYTIIGGVNGAGKSSLSGVLSAENSSLGVIIDPDKITSSHGGDPIRGGKKAALYIEDCLEKEISFTQETTLSGVRTLKTVRKARDKGYFIRLYYVGISSAEESIERIRNRVRKGGHSIPEKDVERRFDSRFDDIAKILPYCDEAVFFDNENGFSEKAVYRNGKFAKTDETTPEWLAEAERYLTESGIIL